MDPEGKKPGLNLKVSEALDKRLEDVRLLYGGAGKNWLAVILLAYGVRHWRKAVAEFDELVKDQADGLGGPPILS